jgi:hypothetical protein
MLSSGLHKGRRKRGKPTWDVVREGCQGVVDGLRLDGNSGNVVLNHQGMAEDDVGHVLEAVEVEDETLVQGVFVGRRSVAPRDVPTLREKDDVVKRHL